MSTLTARAVATAFEEKFGEASAFVVRAPGRVNLIGEHTDYNHGYVLPMAIDRATFMAVRPRTDAILKVYAANLDRSTEMDLSNPERNPDESWQDYLAGVAHELHVLGKLVLGADVLIMGDVPLGCGLSSSASIAMAALALFEELGGFKLRGDVGTLLGQRLENDFLGLSSGIMDQYIIRCAQANHALLLDCRSLECTQIPLTLKGCTFVIANTCIQRVLTDSKYNERVGECATAVEALNQKFNRQATHLRDFTQDELMACRDDMDLTAFRRARHVVSENARTLAAAEALKAGDAIKLGQLMNASDSSLVHDYEVSCDGLMAMNDIARNIEGCYGARMTGAGFGGCTVNLVKTTTIDNFVNELMKKYTDTTGTKGECIITDAAPGAGLVH